MIKCWELEGELVDRRVARIAKHNGFYNSISSSPSRSEATVDSNDPMDPLIGSLYPTAFDNMSDADRIKELERSNLRLLRLLGFEKPREYAREIINVQRGFWQLESTQYYDIWKGEMADRFGRPGMQAPSGWHWPATQFFWPFLKLEPPTEVQRSNEH
jgi:hypothetical protein